MRFNPYVRLPDAAPFVHPFIPTTIVQTPLASVGAPRSFGCVGCAGPTATLSMPLGMDTSLLATGAKVLAVMAVVGGAVVWFSKRKKRR